MAERFKHSKNRVDRAYVHSQTFDAEWRSILNEEGTAPVIRKEENTGWHILSVQLPPESIKRIASNRLSLILGELAYQLRAALDGLIWDAITYTQGSEIPPDAKRTSSLDFPLAPTWKANDVEDNRFHGFPFPQELIDWMRSIQPGSADKPIGDPDRGLNNTLEDIHNLARFDRHRRLRVVSVIPRNSLGGIATLPPGGKIIAHKWLDCNLFNGQHDFLRIKVVSPGALVPYQLRLKGHTAFEVAVENIERYDGETVAVQIIRFIHAVGRVIDRFEAHFA